MYKSIIVIVTILGMFLSQFTWAASSKSTDTQKRIEEMQIKQQQRKIEHQTGRRTSRGVAGKYQAVKLGDDTVFILDTSGGNFWIWKAKSGKEPQYQGQVPEIQK